MAASREILPQNGGHGNVRLHPYFIAVLRWCASSLWRTVTVFLHRLVAVRLPQIKAKPVKTKLRVPGTDHLDPVPRVECVVLHEPPSPTLDVIFVHGLYGSLSNTWRQGDWKPTYKSEPELKTLINHTSKTLDNADNVKMNNANADNVTAENVNGSFRRILPNEEALITERFYDESDPAEGVEDYDAQARFVQDLFKGHCGECVTRFNRSDCECVKPPNQGNACECYGDSRPCDAGCGCLCDACYSDCWPRDWIKIDFPGARVISVNYTSDPYLWRPLWIREIKRLRLHERAEQMTTQLLELGVGRRPIVWVGHSKGGLFIKQIYCDAYEAHLKLINAKNKHSASNNNIEFKTYNHCDDHNGREEGEGFVGKLDSIEILCEKDNDKHMGEGSEMCSEKSYTKRDFLEDGAGYSDCEHTKTGGANEDNRYNDDAVILDELSARAGLWTSSSGFMFYSVPHRGSPLADIKTPITARSIELLEISQNSRSTLSLQSRWMSAVRSGSATVCSLVETRRTLMSVLWLRIVSLQSADAGVGSVEGAGVDHRQVCKPSSRRCPLYTRLTALIHTATRNKTYQQIGRAHV